MANNANMDFKTWVKSKRGRSLAVAQALGVTPPVVSDWVSGKKAIPAERCQAIVAFIGGEVSLKELRPDDWHKYWPDPPEPSTHLPSAQFVSWPVASVSLAQQGAQGPGA